MSDFAVIKSGGKQYIVREGQQLTVDKISTSEASLGFTDLVSGKKVKATALETKKGRKISIRKFKSKARYLRRRGFRPTISLIKIDKIG